MGMVTRMRMIRICDWSWSETPYIFYFPFILKNFYPDLNNRTKVAIKAAEEGVATRVQGWYTAPAIEPLGGFWRVSFG